MIIEEQTRRNRENKREKEGEKKSKTNERYSIARIVVSNIRVRKFGLNCLQRRWTKVIDKRLEKCYKTLFPGHASYIRKQQNKETYHTDLPQLLAKSVEKLKQLTRKSKRFANTYPTALAAPNARIPPLSPFTMIRVLRTRIRMIHLTSIIGRGLVFRGPKPWRGYRRSRIRVRCRDIVLHRSH